MVFSFFAFLLLEPRIKNKNWLIRQKGNAATTRANFANSFFVELPVKAAGKADRPGYLFSNYARAPLWPCCLKRVKAPWLFRRPVYSEALLNKPVDCVLLVVSGAWWFITSLGCGQVYLFSLELKFEGGGRRHLGARSPPFCVSFVKSCATRPYFGFCVFLRDARQRETSQFKQGEIPRAQGPLWS